MQRENTELPRRLHEEQMARATEEKVVATRIMEVTSVQLHMAVTRVIDHIPMLEQFTLRNPCHTTLSSPNRSLSINPSTPHAVARTMESRGVSVSAVPELPAEAAQPTKRCHLLVGECPP